MYFLTSVGIEVRYQSGSAARTQKSQPTRSKFAPRSKRRPPQHYTFNQVIFYHNLGDVATYQLAGSEDPEFNVGMVDATPVVAMHGLQN